MPRGRSLRPRVGCARASLGALVAVGLTVASASCSAGRGGETEARFVAVHNALSAAGFVAEGPVQRGALAEGGETRLAVPLAVGCSTVVALGGEGVVDVDVAVRAEEGDLLAADTTHDAQASARVCVERATRGTVVVRMARGRGAFLAATFREEGRMQTAPAAAAQAGPSTQGGGTCASPITLVPGTILGNTRRGEAESVGGCASSESKEIVYRLELTKRQRVVLDVDPSFDSVLYVRRDACEDESAEVACNDDRSGAGRGSSSGRGSRLDEVLEPGAYFVFVDGYGSEAGTFRLTTSIHDVPTLAEACTSPGVLALGASVSGTFDGAADRARATCGDEARGPDVPYRLSVPRRSRVRVSLKGASAVVHVRKTCADDASELACSDEGQQASTATWAGLLDPAEYTVFADASERDAKGAFTVTAEASPEAGSGAPGDACGDAIPIPLTGGLIEGDTFAAHDDLSGKCQEPSIASGPDVLYRLDLPSRSRVHLRMATSEGAHRFVVRRACADSASEVFCGVAFSEVLPAGSYVVGVDAIRPDAFGRFAFTARVEDMTVLESVCKAPPLLPLGQTVQGTTAGRKDVFRTSCAGPEDRQASPDRVYRIEVPRTGRVRIELKTPTWDGTLALRKTCVDPIAARSFRAGELACNNDAGDVHTARLEPHLEPGTYFVVVDGHLAGNEGAYTLSYSLLP